MFSLGVQKITISACRRCAHAQFFFIRSHSLSNPTDYHDEPCSICFCLKADDAATGQHEEPSI
jgi:hypothetical protein